MFVKLWYIHLLLATVLEYETEAQVTYPMCYLRHLKINKEMKNGGDLISSSSFLWTKKSQEPRCLSEGKVGSGSTKCSIS